MLAPATTAEQRVQELRRSHVRTAVRQMIEDPFRTTGEFSAYMTMMACLYKQARISGCAR